MTIRNVPPVPAFTEWVGADGKFSEAGHNYLAQIERILSEIKTTVEALDADTTAEATADPEPGRTPVLFRSELFSSGTWEAPWDCYIRVWLIGAGGSGGARRNGTTARASGGGGGELSLKESFLIRKGKSLTFTAGAGGASVDSSASDGLPGGTSIVEGEGIYMTALGGAGGDSVSSGTAVGAAGGTAGIGGDNHFPGQASPSQTSGSDGTCGGTFGIVSSPAAPASNTSTAQDALDQMTTRLDIWQWITRGAFTSGKGAALGETVGAGSPGCGGGGNGRETASGTAVSGAGGDGFCIIEYSAPVET